jgi:hypothetical protein
MKAWLKRLLLLGLALATLVPRPALGGQARSSAVTSWSFECLGTPLLWWDDMCMAWRKTLGLLGWSQAKSNYQDVIVSRYVDPSISSWGFDNSSTGFDAGTAALICVHGSYSNVGWQGLMHHKDHNECRADVDQLKYGVASGGSTRFLHLSSCNSMRWDRINAWFGPAKGGVHTITGFHGLMYIGSGYVDEYEDMVIDAWFASSVSESWVDNMYHDPVVGHTICPISMAFGNSKQAALNRLYGEHYSAPGAEQANNFGVLQWISECDPNDADPLPE